MNSRELHFIVLMTIDIIILHKHIQDADETIIFSHPQQMSIKIVLDLSLFSSIDPLLTPALIHLPLNIYSTVINGSCSPMYNENNCKFSVSHEFLDGNSSFGMSLLFNYQLQ